MSETPDLFENLGPDFAPQSDRLQVVAGKVVATMNKPSAAQKRFNTLMAKIDAEQAMATTLRQFLDNHVGVHHSAMRQLSQESQALFKRMALFLDQHIQAAETTSKTKGLTPNQKKQAIHMVLSVCGQLAHTQDAEVQALLKRYDPTADEDEADMREHLKNEAQQMAQDMAESFLGADFAQGREFDSPEDVLRAAMEYEQQQEEKRQAKRAARKSAKTASPKQVAQEQKQEDAQNALRTVFRQLASSLHPDREPDAQLRERKTALMSEVNFAYGRKDLSTLLRIQLQTQMLDAAKAATVSEAKLKAMSDMLAQQLQTLEMENHQLRAQMQHDLGYPAYLRFSQEDVLALLEQERTDLQDDLDRMHADLEKLHDEKAFKQWLKEQARMSKEQLRQAQLETQDFDIDDIVSAMMGRR